MGARSERIVAGIVRYLQYGMMHSVRADVSGFRFKQLTG